MLLSFKMFFLIHSAQARLTAAWTFILCGQERWSSPYSSKLLFMICIAIKGKILPVPSFCVRTFKSSVMPTISGVCAPRLCYFAFPVSIALALHFSSNISV